MNGTWMRKPKNDAVMVFIHGFMSSGEQCWLHDNGKNWPNIVCNDPELLGYGVYVFSYKTSLWSQDYGIGDAADALKEHCQLDEVIKYKNLIFVCHSMGGIVARKYLIDNSIDMAEASKNIGFFLIGSPSLGSRYADFFRWPLRLLGNIQGRGLKSIKNNELLSDIDKNFKTLRDSRKMKIKGKELLEDKPLLPFFSKIVEGYSAGVYFGNYYKIPESDHSTLAKPSGEEAIQHRLLKKFAIDVLVEQASSSDLQYAFDGTPSHVIMPLRVPPALAEPVLSIRQTAFRGVKGEKREYVFRMQNNGGAANRVKILHKDKVIASGFSIKTGNFVSFSIDFHALSPNLDTPISIYLKICGFDENGESFVKPINLIRNIDNNFGMELVLDD